MCQSRFGRMAVIWYDISRLISLAWQNKIKCLCTCWELFTMWFVQNYLCTFEIIWWCWGKLTNWCIVTNSPAFCVRLTHFEEWKMYFCKGDPYKIKEYDWKLKISRILTLKSWQLCWCRGKSVYRLYMHRLNLIMDQIYKPNLNFLQPLIFVCFYSLPP